MTGNKARVEMGVEELEVVVGRGYYKGEQIKANEDNGLKVLQFIHSINISQFCLRI
ncbi:MAG: hypothetical protein GY726_16900 [Proteobacteria bacterium]|nr:hypothetical protein [Pseudomonadota bacterium]